MIGAWARSMAPFACLILLTTLGRTACGSSGITDPGMYGTATTTLQPGSYGSLSETPSTIHKVTIVQFIDGAQAGEPAYQPAPGMKYWTAKVFLENKGTDPITPGQVKLRTRDMTDYDPVTVPGLTASFGTLSLKRGAQATATFVFEIPQDAHPKLLRYYPDPSKDAAIQFTS